MIDIDWRDVCAELNMFPDDAEGVVHELAHAYDCKGEKAFNHVGSQTQVNAMIAHKYGSDSCENANIAELRVSAVTQHVMSELGMLDEALRREIWDNLRNNIRGDWNQHHTREETREMFDEQLARQLNVHHDIRLAQFLKHNFILLPGSESYEDID